MTDHKEYIYAVYREKSFSKAAQSLYVSQPWLSATVKKVEKQLGLPLFDRSKTPISLTAAGEYYIKQIEQIMAIEQEMQLHFQHLRESGTSELRIGSSMFFCTYVLPRLMADFHAMYPQVTLTYSEGSPQVLKEKILNGKLDLLLEAEPPDDPRLNTVPWASEELILAVPADNPINTRLEEYRYTFDEYLSCRKQGSFKPPVPLQEFHDQSFLLLKQDNDGYRRSMQICRNAGFTPNISMLLTQMMTVYYLICEGRGVGFVRSAIPEHVSPTGSVVFYRVDDPLATRELYLSYPRQKSSPMRQDLIDFMEENRFPDV